MFSGVSLAPLQVSLQVTRGVKLQKVSMEGGWCHENVQILLTQSRDVAARLSMLCRVVKVATPIIPN